MIWRDVTIYRGRAVRICAGLYGRLPAFVIAHTSAASRSYVNGVATASTRDVRNSNAIWCGKPQRGATHICGKVCV